MLRRQALITLRISRPRHRATTRKTTPCWASGREIWPTGFGLSGAVSKADFMALANGQNPHTGEQMVKHRIASEQTNPDGSITKTVEHRAGWDATFSAPKSVSLTALVGGDERVRLAHRESGDRCALRVRALHPGADRRQQPRRADRAL